MKPILLAILIFFCADSFSIALSTGINATTNIPGSCKITGVPPVVNIALDDRSITPYSFRFSIDCNFNRAVTFSYSSSCVSNARSCLLKNDGTLVGFDLVFDGTNLLSGQQASFKGNDNIKTTIIVDKAKYVGTYSGTVTLTVNY